MAAQLRTFTFPFGRYHQFVIHDPKERIITAPCFAERVVHHALMNVCEPYFDRWLIADSYASRKGKGRDAAVLRARHCARRFAYFLKADIRKYFDSIPHAGLVTRLERKFKDFRLLHTFRQILAGFRGHHGRGLPIGSLMSQHFANFYLDGVDRLVKEQLRLPGYVRYMDDVILWSNTRATLQVAAERIGRFLEEELELRFKQHPFLNRSRHGVDFLGCRIDADKVRLNRRSRVRYRNTLAHLEELFLQGVLSERELQTRVSSLVAFTRTCGISSSRFRRSVVSLLIGERP